MGNVVRSAIIGGVFNVSFGRMSSLALAVPVYLEVV